MYTLLVYTIPVIAAAMALVIGSIALRPIISEVAGILRRTPPPSDPGEGRDSGHSPR